MSSSRTGSRQFHFSEIDRGTFTIYMALVAIGWLMIYAVNFNPADPFAVFDLSGNPGKQMFFILLCFVLMFFILMTEWAFWRTFGFIIYLGSLVLLLGTLVFGREVNGANAWYQIGGFTFQPSEIAKFGTCLAMSSFLSSTGVNLRDWRSRLLALALFLVPAGIILLQKDTGSALVFFSFTLVMYREGLPSSWFAIGFGTAALVMLGIAFPPPYVIAALLLGACVQLIPRFRKPNGWWAVWLLLAVWSFFWMTTLRALMPYLPFREQLPQDETLLQLGMLAPALVFFLAVFIPNYLHKNSLIQRRLQAMILLMALAVSIVFFANFACYTLLAPHQQQRITIWLKPSDTSIDPRGSAYNLVHSKMAIGSGGFMGKGFLDGNMTKLKYVPEQSTDFIFCTIGEEQGFIGVLGIVGLFTLLLYRITVLAERQRSNFSRLYAYCVAGVIFVHFIVNIGMTMGLFPIIGIPLPFISYGGSSLIGFTLMIGVLLKLDSFRQQA